MKTHDGDAEIDAGLVNLMVVVVGGGSKTRSKRLYTFPCSPFRKVVLV